MTTPWLHIEPVKGLDEGEPFTVEGIRPAYKFDPTAPVSDLAARLLAASNGLHSSPVDGTPVADVGTSRHARKP